MGRVRGRFRDGVFEGIRRLVFRNRLARPQRKPGTHRRDQDDGRDTGQNQVLIDQRKPPLDRGDRDRYRQPRRLGKQIRPAQQGVPGGPERAGIASSASMNP